ncbi:MAG TPA: hypothetical protein PLN53_10115 [Terricaulis sp.]|nr:hypothetical protein [Terricaulis sp.]
MRRFAALIWLPIFLASAPLAEAQERPQMPAPQATAPFDEREAWCRDFTAWFVTRMPEETPRPRDVRPTQRMETELNYCKIDPRAYERQTLAELAERPS